MKTRTIALILAVLLCMGAMGFSPTYSSAEPSVYLSGLKKNGSEVNSTASLSLYDTVTFGRYSQGSYGEVAEIEWIVIGLENGQAKLLSKYALDSQRYHDTFDQVSWPSSSLYTWLNTTFKPMAFDSTEQAMITAPISIPSVQEASAIPVAYRQCMSTAYAIAQGGDRFACIWWLNDQTKIVEFKDSWGEVEHKCCGSVVKENGAIAKGAFQINFSGKTVRPMIYVNLDTQQSGQQTSGQTVSASSPLKRNGLAVTSTSSLSMYDTVTFGSYMQSQYGSPSPIEWIVIGFDGSNRVRLLSKYALDSLPYHDTNSMVTWTTSSLYRWLNNTFLSTAFTGEEQRLIAGSVTLPTEQEAKGIALAHRSTISTAYALANGADEKKCIWWLSDPTGLVKWSNNTSGYCASVVNEKGEIVQKGYKVNFLHKNVRPMVTLDLNGLS